MVTVFHTNVSKNKNQGNLFQPFL